MIQRRTGCSPGRCVVRGVCSSFELRWILSRSVTYRRTDNLNSVFFVLTSERLLHARVSVHYARERRRFAYPTVEEVVGYMSCKANSCNEIIFAQ